MLYDNYVRQINVLVSLYSLTAFVIIIERLSPLTQVLLKPDNFIRLHEINQTVIFLLITVILSFLVLRLITNNFQDLKERSNLILALLFIAGVYLYGAGEGWHEVASFTFNTYCDTDSPIGNLCKGLFINDYYAGNIIFFIGGLMMNFSLLALSAKHQEKRFNNKDITILLANSIVYAFTWFAYAAFDKVLVGLFFSTVLMLISVGFLLKVGKKMREYPYITYSAAAYTLATVATFIVRF